MRRLRLTLAALAVGCFWAPAFAQADPGFLPGPEGFDVQVIREGGVPENLAGSHPYAMKVRFGFNLSPEVPGQPRYPEGDLRNLRLRLPPGLIENPSSVGKCSASDFAAPRSSQFGESASGESCPAASQIGVVTVHSSFGGGSTRTFGLFNLAPAPGTPYQLGFAPYGMPITLRSQIRGAEGSYGITLESVNFPQGIGVHGLELTIWGTPWSVGHNRERGDCLNEVDPGFPWGKCSVGAPRKQRPLAYLTLPSQCSGALVYAAEAEFWREAGSDTREVRSRDAEGSAAGLEGCDETLHFDPRPAGVLTNRRTTSPSGYEFALNNDNEALTNPGSRFPSQVERAVISLPEGVTVNPSLGAGLGVCTPPQYAAETATSPPGAGCPDASKIGDFTVESPLFEETIRGSIFLAEPDDPATVRPGAENPFESLLAIYLVAKLPVRDVLIKVPGKLEPDPATGRLTAIFEELPELPYTNLLVHFREGQRAPLVSPPGCGSARSRIELVPWMGAFATRVYLTRTEVEAGIGGGPCPGGTAPFAPTVLAGSLNSNVGSYSRFYLRMKRNDAEQEITSYSAVLPKGITGKIAGIPFCPEAAVEAARRASGAQELESPSCPAASVIGHTLSGYGVGPALTYASGTMYLAGPYRGQPLSLVTVNSATVGPFDLGTIVIRSALRIDPETAQMTIDSTASDPIPHILDGIPLHLRDIRVYIDRPGFALNPTGCEPSEVRSTLTGSAAPFTNPFGASATVPSHFQLLNCGTLGFKPRLAVKLGGAVRRAGYPSLRAVARGRPGNTNLQSVAVTLPRSQFLAQNHIRGVCTPRQFAAEKCPADAVYGRAVGYSPLFDEALEGPIYMRSNARPGALPDLVADLRAGSIRIVLEGHVGPSEGGIRTVFDSLPDAPIYKFVFTLYGGRRGLLQNSTNLCARPGVATGRLIGQNNKGRALRLPLQTACPRDAKKRRADG
jgi:hypothetical protein